jgi:hypothetical protein
MRKPTPSPIAFIAPPTARNATPPVHLCGRREHANVLGTVYGDRIREEALRAG